MNTNISPNHEAVTPIYILDELVDCKNTDSVQESPLVLAKESTLKQTNKYIHVLKSIRHAVRWSQLKRQLTKDNLLYLGKRHWQKATAACIGITLISNIHLSPQTGVAEASMLPYSESVDRLERLHVTPAMQSKLLQRNYIERFAQVAQNEMKKFNVPASVILALAIVQSNYGQSNLALKGNNHFNIPCKENHLAEGMDGAFEMEGNCFVHYSNAWTSFRANSIWFKENFKTMIASNITDYKTWVENLEMKHVEGASELTAVIKIHNLERFDS